MLNTITWQQYMTAIILCAAIWYAYIGLRFYKPELRTFLKMKPSESSVTPQVASQMTVVMGRAKADTDTGLYDPEKLTFGNSFSDDISDHTLPKGPADDLLAEAETLVTIFRETDNKTEFLHLLKLLIGKYEVYADEISLPAFISSLKKSSQSKLPFQIKDMEWPLTFTS